MSSRRSASPTTVQSATKPETLTVAASSVNGIFVLDFRDHALKVGLDIVKVRRSGPRPQDQPPEAEAALPEALREDAPNFCT